MKNRNVCGGIFACSTLFLGFLFAGCAVPQGAESGKPVSLLGSLGGSETSAPVPKKANPRAAQGALDAGSGQSLVRANIRPGSLVEATSTMPKVGENAWRTSVPAKVVFQNLSRILAQNYVLANVNRKQMTAATEWDKFLIDGRMFRNRVSVSVFPVTSRSTEVVVHNAVEYYEGDAAHTLKDSQWIPTGDVTNEVQRIVGALSRQNAVFARR
jgi:hypothetical protein